MSSPSCLLGAAPSSAAESPHRQLPAGPAFDHLVRLAAAALRAPVALYVSVDDDAPLVVDDVSRHPALRDHPVLRERGVRACLGALVMEPDGQTVGRLCVFDVVPRRWTVDEAAMLHDLAAAAAAELMLRDQGAALRTERVARHAAEARAEAAEWRSASTLERLADAFVAVDRDWCFTYVNAAAERLLRRPRLALLGADAWDAFPKLDACVAAACRAAMASGELRTCVAADAYGAEFEITAHPGFDGLTIQFRDVTAQRHAEHALRSSEERFRSLIEHAADVVTVLGENGRLRYISPPVERVLGIAPADMIGREAFEFVADEDAPRLRALLAELVLTPGRVVPVSYRCGHAEGGVRYFEGTARNLLDVPGVRGVVVNIADVTKRRALEAQLRQAQKLEAVGVLAGGVAHDFNNLLTVIRGNIDFVRDAVPVGSQAADDLAEADKATTRATGLVRQLLAFGGKQVRQPAVIDMNAIVDDAERLLRRVVGEQITVESELEPALWAIRADRGQIEQVLMNLALNARDALATRPSGGVLGMETANVTVIASQARQIGLAGPGEYVRLTVRDTGAGMDDATKARLFEPFFTTKPLGRGTGLGLAVVYGIVAQSAGAVYVESQVGEGSRFHVFLPRVQAEVEGVMWGAAAGPSGSGTILLVEDETAVRRTTRRTLERAGYVVLEAQHGDDALLVWRERGAGRIDALVTDMRMPGMSGADLVAQLRAERPELPVVLMSGYAAATLGAGEVLPEDVRYLEKPFEARDLLAAVGAVIRP